MSANSIDALHDGRELDLTPYIELGGDYSTVCLWRVTYGAPYNTNNDPDDYLHVLALTAEHAILVSNQWHLDRAREEIRPILSIEAIAGVIATDKRFVCSSGTIDCPPKG